MTRRFEIHREGSDTIAGVLWDDGQASTMCDAEVLTWDNEEQARLAWNEGDDGMPVEPVLNFLDTAQVKPGAQRLRVHRYSDGDVLIGDDQKTLILSAESVVKLRTLLEGLP